MPRTPSPSLRPSRPRRPQLLLLLPGLLGVAPAPAPAANRLLPEVQSTLDGLHRLDAPYALPVRLREDPAPAPGQLLFFDLPSGLRLDPSYRATVDFCREFDPMNDGDEEVSDARIRAYLEPLADMAPLREAFRVTRRGLDALQAIWFRRGHGFEHVICGEVGGRSHDRLGGYHFWYLHYAYEREGTARYLGADYGPGSPAEGMADEGIVTGHFTWDPDGEGPLEPLPKVPRGGFSVGHSVAAMLAAGHLAYYGAMGKDVEANLNGHAYVWTFYRAWKDRASSLRTFWPRGPVRAGGRP